MVFGGENNKLKKGQRRSIDIKGGVLPLTGESTTTDGNAPLSSAQEYQSRVNMASSTSNNNSGGLSPSSLNQQDILQIRLREEARERAIRTTGSPPSSGRLAEPIPMSPTSPGNNNSASSRNFRADDRGRDRSPSPLASGPSPNQNQRIQAAHPRCVSPPISGSKQQQTSSPTSPSRFGYDGQSVYTNDGPTHSRSHQRGHSAVSDSTGAAGAGRPASPPGGGGANAGWYMTTGVTPIAMPKGTGEAQYSTAGSAEDLSRSGSLGQKSKMSKYGSLFEATGLSSRSSTSKRAKSPPENEYLQTVSGLPSQLKGSTDASSGAGAGAGAGNENEPLPATVTNAAETAQHRRNVSRDDKMVAALAAMQQQQQQQQQQPYNNTAPSPMQAQRAEPRVHPVSSLTRNTQAPGLRESARERAPMPNAMSLSNNQPFPNVNTNINTNTNVPVAAPTGILPPPDLGPNIRDSLNIKHSESGNIMPGTYSSSPPRNRESIVPMSNRSQETGRTKPGLSSYNRGDLVPSANMGLGQNRQAPFSDKQQSGIPSSTILPPETGEALPASEIARQRELQGAYGTAQPISTGRGPSSVPHKPNVATADFAASPVNKRDATSNQTAVPHTALRTEVVEYPTHGPEQQFTRKSSPKILSTKTERYIEHPIPTISHPAPDHPWKDSLFSNIAQPIPHYMFVNYTANVCLECIASEKRLHSLKHGGERWRYTYSDPHQEKEIPSNDPKTRKTGRQDYQDSVSLANRDGKEPCQCEECLKNRATVKFAAENGLIEKVFGGRRHPASETIETTTYTTIVRAPIIKETIVTVLCDVPNCMECAVKQKEYDESQRMAGLEKAMNGLVVHETDGSGHYEGYKNLMNVDGANSGERNSKNESQTASSKARIERLLDVAGSPRQEDLRHRLRKHDYDGPVVGYEDQRIRGHDIEDVQPSSL